MRTLAFRKLIVPSGCVALAALLGGCAAPMPEVVGNTRNQVIISVRDQKLTVIKADHHRVTFPISTSKFGLGDRKRSYSTPLGQMMVAEKVGAGAPTGSVFHGRIRTGEIVKVDAPGRDAIVTRILALKGLEASNRDAFSRGIYIHGTPEERNIGRPTSYGCIRMRSRDVIELFDMIGVGAKVQILDTTASAALAANIVKPPPGTAPAEPPVGGDPAAAIAAAKNGAPQPKLTGPGAATVSPPPAAAGPTVVAAPAKPGKKEWNGSAGKMLDHAAQAEARARKTKPLDPTRPVSNPSGTGNTGASSQKLNRPATDSL